MKLCLILGDQLSHDISSLGDLAPIDTVMICEVRTEATYVQHHKKKIAFLFSAMRHFAQELEQKGVNVRYVRYDDPANQGSLRAEVVRAIQDIGASELVVTEPGEYRLLDEMHHWESSIGIPVDIRPDDRFLASHKDFSDWATDRKQLRMEYFYREMRQRYSVLMDEDGPVGGQWNFDAENRKPPQKGMRVDPTYATQPDEITLDVMSLVASRFADHFGDIDPFHYAVTRKGALDALALFVRERLKHFGDYQDAMVQGEPWMFHSHIGLYLNCGLLVPLECIEAAESAYHKGHAPLNAVEGFIRQILGWREYVRGIYWLKMPAYKDTNFLEAKRALPQFYWDAQTNMNCLRQCVLETKQNAYAHHIQRLMVLGNFALLAGLDPAEVNQWYLHVYADAYEWVELPNVHGMVLFADGGLLASKPYAASGSYIKKMSNYCDSCSYKVTLKNGPKACPFNYLYWDFLDRNQSKLRGNHRLGFMFKTLDRMSDEKRTAIQEDAHRFLRTLEKADHA